MQRPLATVVIGGVIGAMVMSLLVLRVLYLVFTPRARRLEAAELQEARQLAVSGSTEVR